MSSGLCFKRESKRVRCDDFVMANLCCSAACVVDIPLQHSTLWARSRWILWLAGVLLSALYLDYGIADEIYPYVR